MLIVYLSLTGNTRRFVNKLQMDSLEINPANPFVSVSQPYVVVAPTYEIEATESINDFIEYENNQSYLQGFMGSGNLNFAELYVFTARDLAEKYKEKLLLSFEYSGTDKDVLEAKSIIERLMEDYE